MDRKIYVNFVKGDNDKGTGTLEEPYKTLDHAYTKIRSAGDNSRLIFSLEGPQELSLEKYTNCVLEGTVPGGTDVVKVKTTSFSDMLIDIPMKIELPVKWDQE